MHSAILFLSKTDNSPAKSEEISDSEMHYHGADYWGSMYTQDDVKRSVIEGDCPMFVPASKGKYSVNQEYADRYFKGCYKNMMDAAKKLIGMSLDDIKAFGFGMGFEVFTIKCAYSDISGLLVLTDRNDSGLDTQADFLRWDRHQLKQNGKAPEYYIRGMMDYHI